MVRGKLGPVELRALRSETEFWLSVSWLIFPSPSKGVTFKHVREYLQFPSRKARKNYSWSGTRSVKDSIVGENLSRPLEDESGQR